MNGALNGAGRAVRTFGSDIATGFFEMAHNGFALLGLATVFALVTLVARPDLRHHGEQALNGWLESRRPPPEPTDPDPRGIERATAASPLDLPKQQAAVAFWLSKKYRVAPEPLSVLVSEAYHIGKRTRLDPTLILAIMAVESSFNPFAQSSVGAQGLMQVMTRVHGEKYDRAGGTLAAFDPVTNLRVGVKVLQECIARAGSLEGGLRYYVGAANLADDGGYAAKVLAERAKLKEVASAYPDPERASVRAKAKDAQSAPVETGSRPPSATDGEKIALLSLLAAR